MLIVFLSVFAFFVVRQRSLDIARKEKASLHSLPRHYGYLAASYTLLPSLFVLIVWIAFGQHLIDTLVIQGYLASASLPSDSETILILNKIKMAVYYETGQENDPLILAAAARYQSLMMQGQYATLSFAIAIGCLGLYLVYSKTRHDFMARSYYENLVIVLLGLSSALAILVTVGIVFSLLFESIRFFTEIPLLDFLTGTKWSAQTSVYDDQVAASGTFGAVPLFLGTVVISFIAMVVAVPVGLMAAIYMNQYASRKLRQILKPVLEILAGVPTVVYGFFAALVVAPAFTQFGDQIGIPIESQSAIAAGVVMGIMIIPFISSMADDAISLVPSSLTDGSLALGATQSETIKKVILPAATPGLVGGILLAVSRAIGETMIVVMAAGMTARLTIDPTQSMTTVTVQIVKLLTGDQEFDSAKTLAAFALGLVLFVMTLLLNFAAQKLVRKYQKAYD